MLNDAKCIQHRWLCKICASTMTLSLPTQTVRSRGEQESVDCHIKPCLTRRALDLLAVKHNVSEWLCRH
jgi:hypothetical protein